MAIITRHAPGTFCWPELATTDPKGATSFYTSLLGWESSDSDMGSGQRHTVLRLGGRDLGALYGLCPEERNQGVPPHWNSYVSVESADRTAARAKSLGGTVRTAPFDVADGGRMAILQDPTGGVFCIWQPNKHAGAGVLDEIGALCWTELMTTDAERARAFYTGLFGWTAEAVPMGPMTYTVFRRGEAQAGGMMQITPEMGPIPSHWMVYFAVADCDATVAKAKSLGAGETVPPVDVPNVGRFAVLQDPQGAHVAVIALGGIA